VSATATTVFAAAVVASDEGRHVAAAGQRTARVVSTLALCAMEYVSRCLETLTDEAATAVP
jgi:hypothetical protein